MRRLCVFLILLSSSCWAAEDSAAILNRVAAAVTAQLARAANYACVQTVEREYLISEKRLSQGCSNDPIATRQLSMRDRLRLDVAVSEGNEIYSWHGDAKFTSSLVSDVVHSGPISSGSFVGFLENIFLRPGPRFTYAGEGGLNGSRLYSFHYVVPLASSRYSVQGRQGTLPVPFHGSFSVRAADYQLASLQVVADSIPSDSNICSAETDVTYQMVNISGQPSLIPSTFLLRVGDNLHWHTVSRNEYSECREFRGESTIHFHFTDSAAQTAPKPASADQWLPAGIALHVRLRTPIDDRTSYVGDAVRGVLLKPFKVPGSEIIVPKGARVDGVITKLETHFLPENYQFFSVQLSRLSFNGRSFLLNAHPKTSVGNGRTLVEMYGWFLPPPIAKDYRAGVFVKLASHLRLDSDFAAEWLTAAPHPADMSRSVSH